MCSPTFRRHQGEALVGHPICEFHEVPPSDGHGRGGSVPERAFTTAGALCVTCGYGGPGHRGAEDGFCHRHARQGHRGLSHAISPPEKCVVVVLLYSCIGKKGLNPKGLEGVVNRVATVSRDGSPQQISANYEICVQFKDPKLLAHFRPDELEVIEED